MDPETILFLTPDGPRLYDVGDDVHAPALVQESPDEEGEEPN